MPIADPNKLWPDFEVQNHPDLNYVFQQKSPQTAVFDRMATGIGTMRPKNDRQLKLEQAERDRTEMVQAVALLRYSMKSGENWMRATPAIVVGKLTISHSDITKNTPGQVEAIHDALRASIMLYAQATIRRLLERTIRAAVYEATPAMVRLLAEMDDGDIKDDTMKEVMRQNAIVAIEPGDPIIDT